MKKNECKLYTPIRKALEIKFNKLGECHFEKTSNVLSEDIKRELDDESLFVLKSKRMRPDLIGYVIEKTFNIVIVEVKDHTPILDEIYQTKEYAESLNASYALLISPKWPLEDLRRFLIKRRGVTTFFPNLSNNRIFIGLYDNKTRTIQFDTELYEDIKFDENFTEQHYETLFKNQ